MGHSHKEWNEIFKEGKAAKMPKREEQNTVHNVHLLMDKFPNDKKEISEILVWRLDSSTGGKKRMIPYITPEGKNTLAKFEARLIKENPNALAESNRFNNLQPKTEKPMKKSDQGKDTEFAQPDLF